MAVEKLLPTKFAKIKLRQEALQSIFSGRLDIFYPPNFGCLGRKASFSTATPGYVNYPASPQPETHNDLDVRDNRVRSAHSGLESPASQGLQSGVVHRVDCTAD